MTKKKLSIENAGLTEKAMDLMIGLPETKEDPLKAAVKTGIKRKKEERIREKGAQYGLTPDMTRATLIIKIETLERLKDYAFTKRLKMKDVVSDIIDDYLDRYEKENPENPILHRNE